MTPLPPVSEEDDAAIGELVLGLLAFGDARLLEQRIAQEPALAACHSQWAEAMTTMLAGREVAPPPRLRAAIEAELFPAKRSRFSWAGWMGIVAGPVAALALAFVLLQPPGFDPSLHVDIEVPGSGLIIAAGADEDTLRFINIAGEAPPGRAFELWLIVGDAAPVSLGLLPESGQIDLPRPPGLEVGAIIAVSDEPAGGSTTGAPTGAILGAEPLFAI